MEEGLEIKGRHRICSVSFSEDGEEVVSSGSEGMVRRWRARDGSEVGGGVQAEGATIFAATLSPDGKWLVCGLNAPAYARVWNAETHEKVLDTNDHKMTVYSVAVSSDSTKFATGGSDGLAFVWSMTTRKRHVGRLQHDGCVVAVQFSPNGNRLATADAKSIRIYSSDKGQNLLTIPCQFNVSLSSPLAWSADGQRLFATSLGTAKCFDADSGRLRRTWPIIGAEAASIALSRSQTFIAVAADNSLSFWDAVTHERIGPIIHCKSKVHSIALSPNDDSIATGEENGNITFRSLRNSIRFIPPRVMQLPLMDVSDIAFSFWRKGDLIRAEAILRNEINSPSHHASALAQRALLRSRMKCHSLAIEDSKKSIEAERSVIGYIALAIAHAGIGEHRLAMRAFDLVFTDALATESNVLLLIKAILLFARGEHDDAIARVDDLIHIVDDKSTYATVQAQLFLLHGSSLIGSGDYVGAARLLMRAAEAPPFEDNPYLVLISLVTGWEFQKLTPTIQRYSQECIKPLEDMGDVAVRSNNPEEAIERYSAALSFHPSNPAGLLVKRSTARGMLMLWDDALQDADEAINADPQSQWGYERRHAALHALERYDEAVDAINKMLPLMAEQSGTYISRSQLDRAINSAIREAVKVHPLVLIDLNTGYLCSERERENTFRSEPLFKELVSSMMRQPDDQHIAQVVAGFFKYVTFSHVWEGDEPSYQDVKSAQSVLLLGSSPLENKLRRFCDVVREDGYRWAWSDTCCIDKTISTVLNQSLKMMYKWYEASAATFVYLMDVDALLGTGSLRDSTWMTRAWTSQELLAQRVIRFYDRNWNPYLGDAHANHKESCDIMQELSDAIGITREIIKDFSPDALSVREKLRLASARKAKMDEDVAYSLIGIFKSDIRTEYGEGDAALGHLLEDVLTRSGEVTLLAWAGTSSSYNSCLPATLAVYSEIPPVMSIINDAEMDEQVESLRESLSRLDAMEIHNQFTRLPPARFTHRRLRLPCIIFAVQKLSLRDFVNAQENHYCALVSGIGSVEFYTSHRLSIQEPRKLIFVHPWIRNLRGSLNGYARRGTADNMSVFDVDAGAATEGGSAPTSPLSPTLATMIDDYTRALQLIVRLQQPFQALLLQQQPNGEFKRVAAEHEIIVKGLDQRVKLTKDTIYTIL